MSLLELAERRCVIVTGKGGVGKTSVAAALGLAWAKKGKRVLVAEIVPHADTPSQLKEALACAAPTEEPRRVADNLWLTLVTPTIGHLRFLQDALPLKLLADAAMKSQGLRRFLSAAPGFSDMGVMYRMLDLMKRRHPSGGDMFDICVIDSPATGHALALAQIPEFLTRVIPGGPIRRAAEEGIATLTNEKITGCVIVTLPETLPVTEAIELEKGLGRHRLPVSCIAVNRVPADPFTKAEHDALASLPKTVFGARELQRIDRATAALALLNELHPQNSVVLKEVDAPITPNLAAVVG
ncbi:MAG: ArsA family ATPase [Archangium sp.]